MIHYPTESTMIIWYIIIGVLLLGFFIGIGFVYAKILKNFWAKIRRKMRRPYKSAESFSNQ